MKVHRLTCIECPIGCALEVGVEDEKAVYVKGNACPRGKVYGENEVVEVLQKGYICGDKVIRYAMVKVAN